MVFANPSATIELCRATPGPPSTLHRPDQGFQHSELYGTLVGTPQTWMLTQVHPACTFISRRHAWAWRKSREALVPFPVTCGAKQSCVLAATLFNLLFAQMLDSALSQSTVGVNIHYWYDGDFFNLRRIQSCIKASHVAARGFLFAYDCALAAHSEKEMQELATASRQPPTHSALQSP